MIAGFVLITLWVRFQYSHKGQENWGKAWKWISGDLSFNSWCDWAKPRYFLNAIRGHFSQKQSWARMGGRMNPCQGDKYFQFLHQGQSCPCLKLGLKICWKSLFGTSHTPYSPKVFEFERSFKSGVGVEVTHEGRGSTQGESSGERQLPLAAIKACDLHHRQAIKTPESSTVL